MEQGDNNQELSWEELDAQPNKFNMKDRIKDIAQFNPQSFINSKTPHKLDISKVIGRIDERISLGKIPTERYFCLASQKDQYYRKRSLASAFNATSSQIAILSGLA